MPGTLHRHGHGMVHRSALGEHEVSGELPPGPGTLVFRHESVRVHSAGTAGAAISGTVTEARVMGARQRLRIDPDAGGASVWAEVDLAQPFPPGSRISIDVPIEARHVILGIARDPGRVPIAAPATQDWQPQR
ncbi:TOBE domain-containing protein [Hoyosella sp. G463]|uniref:TOBE domain-containing protein n=2 Tax=Lolliginicoccus lacisalsi TaxID=2742202 RepID=A0A927JDU8_9ACTN|nr:TOBE domain-containing protein [Lolliginicoccus lacisalsi]